MTFEQALSALREGKEVTNTEAPRPWKLFMKDGAIYWQTLEIVPAPTIYLARFDQKLILSVGWQVIEPEPEKKRRGRPKGYVVKTTTVTKIRARRLKS